MTLFVLETGWRMSNDIIDARLSLLLSDLKLSTMRKVFGKIANEVSGNGGDFRAFLQALLEEELKERRMRRISRRIKEARFRQLKLLTELEENSLPKGISPDLLNELASGGYMNNSTNIIAIGNSGTGKTHVCTGLAVAACNQGKRVRTYTAAELVSELEFAQENHQLHRFLLRFAKWDLVFIDELGYLPISEHGADLLFQACSERHERGSVMITTNLPFSDWGQVFKTERLAVAMLDRITHNATILEMNGESYRLKSAIKRKGKKMADD